MDVLEEKDEQLGISHCTSATWGVCPQSPCDVLHGVIAGGARARPNLPVDRQLPCDPGDGKFIFTKLIKFFLPASQCVLPCSISGLSRSGLSPHLTCSQKEMSTLNSAGVGSKGQSPFHLFQSKQAEVESMALCQGREKTVRLQKRLALAPAQGSSRG